MKIRIYRGYDDNTIRVRYNDEHQFAPMDDISHWANATEVWASARGSYSYIDANEDTFDESNLLQEINV